MKLISMVPLALFLLSRPLYAQQYFPVDEDALADMAAKYTMFDLMRATSHAFEFGSSAEDVFGTADIVVRGYIDSVTDGRTIVNSDTLTKTPERMALFRIEVEEMLKGAPREFVYLEVFRGNIPAEYFDAAKSMDLLEIYLSEKKLGDSFDVRYPAGGLVDDSDTIYALTSETRFYMDNDSLFGRMQSNSTSFPVPSSDGESVDGVSRRD